MAKVPGQPLREGPAGRACVRGVLEISARRGEEPSWMLLAAHCAGRIARGTVWPAPARFWPWGDQPAEQGRPAEVLLVVIPGGGGEHGHADLSMIYGMALIKQRLPGLWSVSTRMGLARAARAPGIDSGCQPNLAASSM